MSTVIATHSLADAVRALRDAKTSRAIGEIQAAFTAHDPAAWELAVLDDVARLALERARAHDEARRDPLTGLLNRRGFFERARRVVGQCPGPVAVGLCDIDGLKAINDRYGHDAGSAVLRAAADALEAGFGAATIGRIGGDEFAVLIPDRTDAERLRNRLAGAVRERASAGDVVTLRVSVGFATGIATCAEHVEDLLRYADADLYARRRGRRRAGRRHPCRGHQPRPNSLQLFAA